MSSKTEDMIFHCPLCCRKEFHSKKSLADHLSSVVLNLICPVCNVKHSSIESLADHLNCDECETTNSNGNDQFHSQSATELTEHDKVSTDQDEIVTDIGNNTTGIQDNIPSQFVKLPPENIMEVNKFVQLLDKQMHKPCLETQEFKFVLEDRTRHYVYLPNEDAEQSLSENTIVTKQNNDGTISLTSLKAPKLESNPLSAASDLESDENQKEIYTCNTCGVSFLSVIDHIQNFHNDQDVVVEEPLDDAAAANDEASNISETHRTLETTSPTNDKQTLRRMITETGDIIETPLVMKATEESKNTSTIAPLEYDVPVIDEAPKQKQAGKKENTNHNVKNNDEDKSGLYHKVVLQELVTSTGNKVKIYHCIICNIYVPTLAEFKSRPCAIVQPNKYACPHCPVVYDNSKSLCAHMKVHKTKEIVFDSVIKLNFECTICSTIFPTSKSLKLHKRMHDPIKSRPIEPPVPTKEGELMSEDKYMCSVCNKLIPIDYRAIHQNSHMNSDTLNCHICNKKFTSREYLDMHMNVHNLDKVVVGKQDKSLPYTCVYCNRQFARPHEKVKHERIHTGEKPHSCEICGKSFRVSYCLTLHMRTHTGARPYACHHCGKRFKAHSVYNHHLLTHSEVRAYKCPYCPKAFKTSVQLAGHKNSHTKPFSCQQCNRPFASLYAVRVHMDSHAKSNSLKFACSLCGASYARAFALKDHVRQVHSDHLESALKQEEWSLQDCDEDKESIQLVEIPDQEINELEMNADELIVS